MFAKTIQQALLALFFSITLFFSASLSEAYTPRMRAGWPQEFDTASGVTLHSTLSWTVVQGEVVIAVSGLRAIALYDLDGQFLDGWPIELSAPWIVAFGPYLGQLDEDDEPEICVLERNFEGDVRRLEVYELDGTPVEALSRDVPSTGRTQSAMAVFDADGDGRDELFFTADSVIGIDDNGTHLAGFPYPLGGAANYRCGVVGVPLSYPDGGKLLWPTQDSLYCITTSDSHLCQGWPRPIRYDEVVSSPIVLPHEASWVVVIATDDDLTAWKPDGTVVEGFPIDLPEEWAWCADISAADIDGDGAVDIVVRKWDGVIRAYHLDGTRITGFPTERVGWAGDQVVALFSAATNESWLFSNSFDIQPDYYTCIDARDSNEQLQGFPIIHDQTRRFELNSALATIWEAGDDTLHLVHNSANGMVNVWDVPMPGQVFRLEWPMPGGNEKGNRVYQPGAFLTTPEHEEHSNLPSTPKIQSVYPNPGNSSVVINLAGSGGGRLCIYNLLGEEVWSIPMQLHANNRGNRVAWNTRDVSGTLVPSGFYVARLSPGRSSLPIIILR